MIVLVQRSMLTRTTQLFSVEVPDHVSAQQWIDADPSGFDDHVRNTGYAIPSAEETSFDVANNDLEVRVFDQEDDRWHSRSIDRT